MSETAQSNGPRLPLGMQVRDIIVIATLIGNYFALSARMDRVEMAVDKLDERVYLQRGSTALFAPCPADATRVTLTSYRGDAP